MGDREDRERLLAEIAERRRELEPHRGGSVRQHRRVLDEAEAYVHRGKVANALGLLVFLDRHPQPILRGARP